MRRPRIGRQLFAKKAALPPSHFGPWLRETGISYGTALEAMSLAKASSLLKSVGFVVDGPGTSCQKMEMTDTDDLVRKLKAVGKLSNDDQKVLESLPLRLIPFKRGVNIATDGDVVSRCCLVVAGFMHRCKMLPDGKRQILSFHPPGDIPDLQSLHLRKMDHNLSATVDCLAGFISHSDLKEALLQAPGLSDLLWRDTLIESAGFRTWMVMMGQTEADSRMAHLFCEMFARLSMTGVTIGQTFQFPITQTELGDTLGISPVHANRSLQALRELKLVEFAGKTVTILDWDGLRRHAQFDPAYLHFNDTVDGHH